MSVKSQFGSDTLVANKLLAIEFELDWLMEWISMAIYQLEKLHSFKREIVK